MNQKKKGNDKKKLTSKEDRVEYLTNKKAKEIMIILVIIEF